MPLFHSDFKSSDTFILKCCAIAIFNREPIFMKNFNIDCFTFLLLQKSNKKIPIPIGTKTITPRFRDGSLI